MRVHLMHKSARQVTIVTLKVAAHVCGNFLVREHFGIFSLYVAYVGVPPDCWTMHVPNTL